MLTQKILRDIKLHGPMRLDQFMQIALFDPHEGYYTTRQVFGAGGDFTTAPEISQIFGEICAVYFGSAMAAYRAENQDVEDMALIELGPGRGVLMADMLRTFANMPQEYQPTQIVMVESSVRLQQLQRQQLHVQPIHWQGDIDQLPNMPCMIIANEFFDALPIRQAIHTGGKWYERVVNVEDDTLVFDISDTLGSMAEQFPDRVEEGTIYESSDMSVEIMRRLSLHIATHGGMMMLIDYGYTQHRFGDTLQAVKQHRYAAVLEEAGHADLTAHVNFAMLRNIAKEAGLQVQALTTQGAFLRQLGAELRASTLCKHATGEQIHEIMSGMDRLIAPDKMGELFKVLIVASPDMPMIHSFV